jgi:hypothetical protein
MGSPTNPIIIISAADETKLNSNTRLFGVLYIFDGEGGGAVVGSGGPEIYGSMIVDGDLSRFNGNVAVVYTAGILARASGIGSVGAAEGGWRDFGVPDFSAN